MTDRKTLADQNETPEDVATLYSWANLHGAKYRDFSAARAQTREKARLRVQQVMDEQREQERMEAGEGSAEQLRTGASHLELQRGEQVAIEQTARQDAARQSAQQAAHLATQEARVAERAWGVPLAAEPARTVQRAAQEAQAAEQALLQIRAAQRAVWPQAQPEPAQGYPAPAGTVPSSFFAPQSLGTTRPSVASARVPASTAAAAAQEEQVASVQPDWGTPEMRDAAHQIQEAATRPAWLNGGHAAETPAAAVPPPQVPEDTLQGQRDRMTNRWYALKSVFQSGAVPAEPEPAPSTARAPVLAFFSLAGGVGKTSLAATLGRALSARGERVLLVDTAPYGLLPFYFGARDQRPGQLRTFTPPGASGDAPVQMITLDPEGMGPESGVQELLAGEIGKYAAGVGRVLVDLATASGATARRVLRMVPLVLVPVTPDMNSVVSVAAIDAFFQKAAAANGPNAMPFYVLNQFDVSLPLHLDVREVLREQLGDRLLPFALRRAAAVSEALAEGMTVIDYAPNSTVAEDFANLAGWVKSQSAPASSSFRGVRWSER